MPSLPGSSVCDTQRRIRKTRPIGLKRFTTPASVSLAGRSSAGIAPIVLAMSSAENPMAAAMPAKVLLGTAFSGTEGVLGAGWDCESSAFIGLPVESRATWPGVSEHDR